MTITLERTDNQVTDPAQAPTPLAGPQLDTKVKAQPPTPPSADNRSRWMISPGALSGIWAVAVIAILAIDPAPADPTVRPTLMLQVLAETAAFMFYGVLLAGMLRWRHTPALGLGLGGLLAVGHLICGLEGHVPMTGVVWPAGLLLIAAGTIASGLSLATKR